MNLVEAIYKCLVEFTNPENEIRQEAENNFTSIIQSVKCDEILSSLLEIIDKYPQSNVSFSAAIQLRYYSFYFIGSKFVDDEYLLFFRNTIQQYLIDTKFPTNIRIYMISIISILYVISLNPKNLPYPDLFDYLDKVLRIPDLYANILEFYTNFIYPTISPDLFNFYDEERVHFIFSHLDPTYSQKDRSYSAIYFLCFWDKYSSELSSSIDFLSILNDLDDQYFRNLSHSLISAIISDKIEINSQILYYIFYNRIIDDSKDELLRQFCLNDLTNLICQNKSFFQIFCSDLPKFMEMMFITTSNPQKYQILYDESKETIRNMKDALHNCQQIVHLLYIMSRNPNPYVSSLFQRFTILTEDYQNGILYSSQEDPFIRENGYRYLRKLIKYRKNELYSISNKAVEEIATCLFESYIKFKDILALKALSTWCNEVRSDTLSIFADSIVDLCTNILSFETIECGSALLRLHDKKGGIENTEDDEFALFLLQNVNKLLSSDCQLPPNSCTSLEKLVDCLPTITRFVSMEKKIELMNFLIPILCNDIDSLFSENLYQLFVQLKENINLYENPVLSCLFTVYTDAERTSNSLAVTNFLYAISSYGKFFPIFEEKYLKLFLDICLNIIKETNTYTEASIPFAIRAIGKMLSYFTENANLFDSIFEFPFSFIFKDNDIENVKYYLKIIYKLISSNYFNEERTLFVLNFIKPLLDHCSELIATEKESNNMIDSSISTIFDIISDLFYKIVSSLFFMCKEEICQIVSTSFLEISNLPLEMQTSVVNIYFVILQNTENLNEFSNNLFKNLFNILSMMPTGQEGYQEMENKLLFNEITSFYSLQEVTVTGLGNLFYQKRDLPIELADHLIEIIINIVSLKNENSEALNEFQGRSISCLSKLIFAYKLNIEQANLISLIYQWLPRFNSIDDLTFYCYFQILLFCISTNLFENDQKICEMISLLCKCVAENRVPDKVLRDIFDKYNQSVLDEILKPLLVEIHKFLE